MLIVGQEVYAAVGGAIRQSGRARARSADARSADAARISCSAVFPACAAVRVVRSKVGAGARRTARGPRRQARSDAVTAAGVVIPEVGNFAVAAPVLPGRLRGYSGAAFSAVIRITLGIGACSAAKNVPGGARAVAVDPVQRARRREARGSGGA